MTLTAAQLKAARARLDWSQDDVASVVGVDVLTIVNFENGKKKPDPPILVDIRIALEAAGVNLSLESRAERGATTMSDEAAVATIAPNVSYGDSSVSRSLRRPPPSRSGSS
jgi:DNA-binding XRE family transcriptional regulator